MLLGEPTFYGVIFALCCVNKMLLVNTILLACFVFTNWNLSGWLFSDLKLILESTGINCFGDENAMVTYELKTAFPKDAGQT